MKKTPPPFRSLLLGFEPLCSQNPLEEIMRTAITFAISSYSFPLFPWIIYHGANNFSTQAHHSKWAWTHVWENQQWHMTTIVASFPFWGGSDWVVSTSRQTLAAGTACKGNLAPKSVAWDLEHAADQSPLLPPQELRETWGWFNPTPETPPLWMQLCQPALHCSHPSHPPLLSLSCDRDYNHFWTVSSASPLNLFIPRWHRSK